MITKKADMQIPRHYDTDFTWSPLGGFSDVSTLGEDFADYIHHATLVRGFSMYDRATKVERLFVATEAVRDEDYSDAILAWTFKSDDGIEITVVNA